MRSGSTSNSDTARAKRTAMVPLAHRKDTALRDSVPAGRLTGMRTPPTPDRAARLLGRCGRVRAIAADAARGRLVLREPALARGALVGLGLLPPPRVDRRSGRRHEGAAHGRGSAVGAGLDARRLPPGGLDARPSHLALDGRGGRDAPR